MYSLSSIEHYLTITSRIQEHQITKIETMLNHNTKHEKTKIDEYIAKGYTSNYQMCDGKLKDLASDKLFKPNQVKIIKEYRYEGMSNPDDLSILYILETEDGNKGTLLMPYGPTANDEMAWFMKDVSLLEKNKADNRNI